MERRYLYLCAIAGSIAFILFAIFPWRGFDPVGHWHRVGWIPFVSRPIGIVDIVGNLLLFVPLGASIALHAQRSALRRTAAVAFACSLFGEWSQIYSRYRYPTTQDILLNVVGAVVAAYAVDYLRRRRRERAEAPEAWGAPQVSGRRVEIMYGKSVPPTLINGRGQARVD
jgi:glycopeptide antibiotics resistance protein